MAQLSTTRRTFGFAIATAVAIGAAVLIRAEQSSATQGSQLVRGNKPGEWRYWGGDAWSTRYSALDQINAERRRVR